MYIYRRKPLWSFLLYFTSINFIFGFLSVLLFPLLLSFASEATAGAAFSLGALGMLVGSLVVSAWGGPQRRVLAVIGADFVIAAGLLIAAIRPSIVLFTVGAFVVMFVLPIANAASQALWQSKVELDVQGRVFAVRRATAQAAIPVAYLLAGPLADRVFEPLMAEGGALAATVGQFIGVGEGRGYALFFIVLALASVVASLVVLAYEPVRTLEETMPDVIPDPVPAEGQAS